MKFVKTVIKNGKISTAPSVPATVLAPTKKVYKAKPTAADAMGPKSLIQELHKNLGQFQKARPYSSIHASMLTYDGKKFCPREVALCDLTGKDPDDEYISPALQATFDLGWAVHHMVTDNWLRSVAVGHWRCDCGHFYGTWSHYPKGICDLCKRAERWKYVEGVFVDKALGHTGSIDLIADLGFDQLIPVEIKSIDKDAFKELKAPMAEHRVRSVLYMDMIKQSEHPQKDTINTERAKILYVSKGFGYKQGGMISPFKEYDVAYKYTTALPYIDMASDVNAFREEGLIPEGICQGPTDKRTKQCPCAKECFSGEYPAG
jgi:hypothetical protein